jgi:hypothetical protein
VSTKLVSSTGAGPGGDVSGLGAGDGSADGAAVGAGTGFSSAAAETAPAIDAASARAATLFHLVLRSTILPLARWIRCDRLSKACSSGARRRASRDAERR